MEDSLWDNSFGDSNFLGSGMWNSGFGGSEPLPMPSFSNSGGGGFYPESMGGGDFLGELPAGFQSTSQGGGGLSSIFGKGGTINQFTDNYGGALKLGGGFLDYLRKNQQAKDLRGMMGPQQQFAQQASEGSQYWNQSAKNAQMGTDALTTDAIRQAQQVAERTGNQRGINPIHVRLAAQQAMAEPRMKAVDSYGRLALGFGNNVNGSTAGLTGMATAANTASNNAYSALGAGLYGNQSPLSFVIDANGRIVPAPAK